VNAPIRRLAFVVAAMFCVLLLSTTWIQFVQAKDLADRPGNRRTLLASYSKERGAILVDGKPVAQSLPTKDQLKWIRAYPQGKEYSHVTGYYSFTYGAGGGLESAENELLSGQSDKLFYRRIVDVITGKPPQGATLELTIDAKVQQAAEEALGDQRGAVVALDPTTGAILAMVSKPQYDPNALASHNLTKVSEAWKSLNADKGRPMINRAIAGDLYPPGSTFKLVTAAAALSSGKYSPSSVVPGPRELDLPDTSATLPNFGHEICGPNGTTTLRHALEMSCNSSFGWLGLQLGPDALRSQADKFGFGQTLHVPMRVTPSVVPDELNKPQTAQAAVGQYDVRVTPLQVAMVTAGIANGGTVMSPYLVKDVRSSDLDVIDTAHPQQLSEAVRPGVADQLTSMMEDVVNSGTGRNAQIPGVQVAGKTGTAEHGEGLAAHVWFTGFAPAKNPKIAVAVVVEDGGTLRSEATGSTVSAPIAKKVMEAGLGR
jgi:peptidoglycan glycosyltransferase